MKPVVLLAALVVATAAAADPLAEASRTPGWVTYTVPLAGREAPCCFANWRSGEPLQRACTLDRRRDGMFGTIGGRNKQPVPDALRVFLRFEHGTPRQLLAVGSDCPVDPGKAEVRELSDVAPTASAALLLELIEQGRGDLPEEALHALQLHAEVGTASLLALARDSKRPPAARRQALFWLAQSDDPRALAEIEAILSR